MNDFSTMPLRFRVWDSREGKFCAEALPDKMKIEFDIWEMGWWLDVDEWHRNYFIISQDTGLKDKNGKSIYTGDIVELDGKHRYPVAYEPFNGSVVAGNGGFLHTAYSAEVIGNIWQNQELLEGKSE